MLTSHAEEKSTLTYYEVLGVAPMAELDEIKVAHRSLALQWHPNNTGSCANYNEGEEARPGSLVAAMPGIGCVPFGEAS
eukprot:scaffold246347_cov47-Attheya_sp.AAC.3